MRIMPGSAALVPIHLLRSIRMFGKPKSLVYRYLNDYPSLLKTILRLLSEVLTVAICILMRIRVVWIAHNVDRESNAHHPLLSNVRRLLISRVAHRILVMDPLLVAHAREIFPAQSHKIGHTSFGPLGGLAEDGGTESWVLKEIEKFARRVRGEGMKVHIGLCVGTPHPKKPHFEDIPGLLDNAQSVGVELRMVVIGPVGEYLKTSNPTVLERLRNDPRVLFLDGLIPVDEVELAPHVDFYWRVSLDLSIPLGVYTAATSGKPILTRRPGFLSEAVDHYGLGSVMKEDMSDLEAALRELERWTPTGAMEFVSTHTWRRGAEAIGIASGLDVRDSGQSDSISTTTINE